MGDDEERHLPHQAASTRTATRAPHWETFTIPYAPGMTVLDGLWKIKELHAPGARLALVVPDGRLRLVRHADQRPAAAWPATRRSPSCTPPTVTVAPLPNFDIIRDLVPDLAPMFEHAPGAACRTSIRDDVERAREPDRRVLAVGRTSSSSTCSSPTASSAGAAWPRARRAPPTRCTRGRCRWPRRTATTPTPATAASRRARRCSRASAGPWRCHFAGECSRVCPKGVDPAKAIQLMKRELVLDLLHLRKQGCPAPVAKKPTEIKRRDGVPDAPARTV